MYSVWAESKHDMMGVGVTHGYYVIDISKQVRMAETLTLYWTPSI